MPRNLNKDGIVSLEQFGQGFQWQFPRIQQEEFWDKWYDGEFDTLFPSKKDIENGLNQFDIKNLIKLDLFSLASDFYTEAVVAEGPEYSTEDEALRLWLDEMRPTILEVLGRMVLNWSIKGRGILVTHEDGTLHAVDASSYFRVGEYYDPDETVGHILAYRYRVPESPGELNLPNSFSSREPNRIRVTKYAPVEDINTVQTFMYAGHTIGTPVTGEENAGVTALAVVGKGDSWYGDAQRVAAQLMIMLTLIVKSQHKHLTRPVMLPHDVLANIGGKNDKRTPREKLSAVYNEKDPVFTISEDSMAAAAGLIPGDYDFVSTMDTVLYLAQTYYLLSGLPPTSFGIDIGKGESGFAREKSEDRAAIRARNVRDDMAKALPLIIKGMGAPDGELSVSWRSSPFESRIDREARVEKYLALGLITVAQAQQMLGLDVTPVENAPETNEDDNANTNGN